MRILITGSDGFTGRHMMPFLLNKGVEVAGFSRNANSDHNKKYYSGDLLDKSSLLFTINDFKPDVILHFAGIALPGFTDIELMYRINMFGTKNLLDAAVESGMIFSKIIVASSAQVYGVVGSDSISELHTTLPSSHYGNSKLGMENICRLYMDKLSIAITRPFNYSGYGQSQDYILAKIIAHYSKQLPEITLGNIDVVRDFSYIDDVLNYYWALITVSQSRMIVNICSGIGTSLRTILDYMDKLSGYKIKVNSSNSLLRPQDNPVFVGDTGVLKSIIGSYQPLSIPKMLQKISQMKDSPINDDA